MSLLAGLLPAVAAHLGTLHTYETVLVLVIAFGPFLVIAALLLRERRRDAATRPGGADRVDRAHDPTQRSDPA